MFRKLVADADIDKPKYGNLAKAGNSAVVGTKYNHLGTGRSGLASYMDKQTIEHNLEQREKNYGGGGYAFQMLGKDGKPDPEATLNIGGRVHKPRHDGSFYVVDEAYLSLCEREESERKEYVKSIVRKCVISDEICAKVLGLDIEVLEKLCASKGCATAVILKKLGMSPSIDEYDCTPSYLDCIDESSTFFSGGISKLTKIVNGFMPVLEKSTPSSVTTKGEE